MSFNEKAYALGSKRSVIREIFEYSKARAREIGAENVFDFSIGNPSVPTPDALTAVLRELISEDPVAIHGYTSAQGDASARRAVASGIKSRFGVDISPDLIYMTCGAAASLSICLHAILEPDKNEECVVFAPFFTEYRVFIEAAGGKVTVCPPKEADLDIDIGKLGELISPATKAVIINSPNNPSGTVYPEETVIALCKLLRERSAEYGHTIYLIADEPYRELVYDGVFVPYLMNYYDATLVCYSYSKSLSLPGERIGYIAVSPNCPDANGLYLAICGAGRSLGYVCAPSLFQLAVARCEGISANVEIYRENRDLIYGELSRLGFTCVKPDGAFYLFVKSPSGDAVELYERAKGHELLLVPCDDFGVRGYVRLAYCTDKKMIERSLPAFRALAAEYFNR